MVTNKQKI